MQALQSQSLLSSVRVPMKDGDCQGKREPARAQGKTPSGPAVYPEVGGSMISSYDQTVSGS